jgi:CHAT domain-containing protein
LQVIQGVIPHKIPKLVLRNPTKDQVMSTFREQQIVHLACHGTTSVIDPSQSGLLLEDWKQDLLKVSDLISLRVSTPQLAFLSACHSAASRDVRLLDETINMSSAFQLLGFSSVVGTLWQIIDSHSPDVVKDVYSWMVDEEMDKVEIKRSAAGLHHAIRRLRDETRRVPGFSQLAPDKPLTWAAYVHLGA